MKYLIIVVIVHSLFLVTVLGYMQLPKFGPSINTSAFKGKPHFADGKFLNLETTPVQVGDKSTFSIVMDDLRNRAEHLTPDISIPAQNTDLKSLKINFEIFKYCNYAMKNQFPPKSI